MSSGEHDARGVSEGRGVDGAGATRGAVRRARSFLTSRASDGGGGAKDDQGDVGLGPMRARNHDTSRVSSKSMHPRARARAMA